MYFRGMYMKRTSLIILLSGLFLFAKAQHECASHKIIQPSNQVMVSSNIYNLGLKYDVKFHHFNLNVERTNKYISGSVRTLAQVVATSLDTFGVELYNTYTIDSIRLNGQLKAPVRNGNDVKIPVSPALPNGSMVDVIIYYKGTAPTINGSAIGDGFNNRSSTTWGNVVTWSLSEPNSAYEWWPCKQNLRDKIDSVYMFVTTDSTNKVGANGVLSNIVTVGNKKRYEWKSRYPIDYYLISLSVAKYVDYRIYAHPVGLNDSILVQNYIYDNPATLPNFKSSIDQTPQLIELFSALYGMYPFRNEKYGHSMAPLGGGMEHQTMTTLGSFNFTLIAHELGHQWWGDQVTCKRWQDIFVNESFASYSEQLAIEKLQGASQASSNMNSVHNSVMSQNGGSVYCPDSINPNRIFDSRLSYDKGCAIIHSLRFEMNDDTLFFNTLKTIQNTYKNGTAGIEEVRMIAENVSGQNFNQFFNQWIYGEGYPTFNVKWNQVGSTFILKSTQTVSMASVTPLFMTSIEYKLQRAIGDTVIRVFHGQPVENYVFTIGGSVTGIVVDPNNWILNKVIGPAKDITLTSIDEFENQAQFVVFPNPANEEISVRVFNSNEGNLSILDACGRIVWSGNYQSEISAIAIGNLNDGLYFIQVTDKASGRTALKKFLKN